ncbi:TonB-dependent receptor domain-containing protein [Hoylesella shahii]|uniref:TonB-dependent receptor domain-containing protein n=1 Tax=Hoylesella shahii TaxID=228603 RepID=UPI001E52B4BB|nr:TonB-dependent receptor [Hoylesella shahii]
MGTEITPMKNLSVNFDYTFSFTNDMRKINGGTIYAYDMFATAPFSNFTNIYGLAHNMAEQSSQYTLQNIFKGYATYMFDIEKQHNFKLMAGFDAETREAFSHYSERQKLYNEKYPEIALAYGNQFSFNSLYSYHNDFAAAGVFGRINYDYLQRYLFEFNLRYDGSSRFPVGKKWAFFPSFSAGWRASEEKFMDWAKPALTNLKLRGSWGTIGNQDVAAYSYLSIMLHKTRVG